MENKNCENLCADWREVADRNRGFIEDRLIEYTEHRSPYQETVSGMLSPDYKERFKAEYQQTKIRYEKLKAFCNRIEAAMRTCPGDTKRIQMPEHDCPFDLLRDQQRAMGEYLHCLEIRAVIEGIEL